MNEIIDHVSRTVLSPEAGQGVAVAIITLILTAVTNALRRKKASDDPRETLGNTVLQYLKQTELWKDANVSHIDAELNCTTKNLCVQLYRRQSPDGWGNEQVVCVLLNCQDLTKAIPTKTLAKIQAEAKKLHQLLSTKTKKELALKLLRDLNATAVS